MYRYFAIGAIILGLLILLLTALNISTHPTQLYIYRDSALMKIDNRIDLDGLSVLNIYGRYDLLKMNNYLGTRVKFIWNNREIQGTVVGIDEYTVIVKDPEGYYYRLDPNSLVAQDTNLTSTLLDPIGYVYVNIDRLKWEGSSILRLDPLNSSLDIGFKIINNNKREFRYDQVELVDANLRRYSPILYKYQSFQLKEASELDKQITMSRIVYTIKDLVVPAMSTISRTVESKNLKEDRVNRIFGYLYNQEVYSQKGNPSLYINFRAPTDIPSGTIEIYDEYGRLLNVVDIDYYPKDSSVDLYIWENRGIEYNILYRNLLNRKCDQYMYCNREIIRSNIEISLKNLNPYRENVEISIWLDGNYTAQGDLGINNNTLFARVELGPGETKTLIAELIK
ncbi:MAG: hypothetical protein QW336_02090 [Candidatus Anstonellales archaeon]